MKYFKSLFTAFTLLLVVFVLSCKKEKTDPIIPNEEELITSLYLTLIDSVSNDTIIMSFIDLDGDGGNPPVITNGTLQANSIYSGYLVLLNEAVTPAIDISQEVAEEAEEHQVFYEVLPGLNLSTEYQDEDANTNPLGLSAAFTTAASSNGELRITLRHEPDKFADGVSDGDISNAGGETDIQVTFDIEIQ